MNAPAAPSSPTNLESPTVSQPALVATARPRAGAERASGWWYAFDRWLPVAARRDEFVLA